MAGAVIALGESIADLLEIAAGVLTGAIKPHPGIGLDVDSLLLERRDAGQQRVALAPSRSPGS